MWQDTGNEYVHTKVMKKLQDSNFIKKVQNGVYQVSPLIMMKGSEHKKQLLLNYYDDTDQQMTLDDMAAPEA